MTIHEVGAGLRIEMDQRKKMTEKDGGDQTFIVIFTSIYIIVNLNQRNHEKSILIP